MGAMTNLLVKDDAATPKEWTFEPVTDNPYPFWRTNDATLPLDAQPRLGFSEDPVKSGGFKLTAKLEVPVMETLGASGTALGYVAPPKVAYVVPCIFTMFVDRRSTIADRANVYKMMLGLLQGASSTTATGTLANTAAGGAFAANTSPALQFFTKLIVPS